MGLRNLIAKGNSRVSCLFPDFYNDYITVPNSSAFTFGTGGMTISAWIYTTESNQLQTIVESFNPSQADGYESGFQFNLGGENSVGNIGGPTIVQKLALYVGDNSDSADGYSFMVCDTGITVISNVWQHIVVSYTPGTVVFYVNGVLSSTISTAPVQVAASSSTLTIGATADDVPVYPTAEYAMIGNLTHLSMWNTVLPGTAITALYNGGNPPNIKAITALSSYISNLVAWWKLGAGDNPTVPGSIWIDSSGNGHNGTTHGGNLIISSKYP